MNLSPVLENLASGIVVLDPENKVVEINPAAVEILGLPLSSILNHPLSGILDQDADLFKILRAGLDDTLKEKQELVFRIDRKQKTYELRISSIRDQTGPTGRMLQFTDISLQKQGEENLAKAKINYTSQLDQLKDYFFETDLKGFVTNINQAFCEHLGYSNKEDVLGKHFRRFTDRESARQVFLNFSKVFKTGETVELFQYSYHTRDGKAHIGETTVSPILENGIVIGGRGVLRDITDRVKAENDLRQAKEDIEARAEELAAINRIATLSNQSQNLPNILKMLCEELTNIFPVHNAEIGLITADKDCLEIVAFHSIDEEESRLGTILDLASDSFLQEVIEQKKVIVKQSTPGESSGNSASEESTNVKLKTIMIVPLLTRGNAIGTINLPGKDAGHVFTEKEIKLAEIIASQIAATIDNAQLLVKTEKALDIAEQDLEIGRQIQSGFFPETAPDIPGWEISAHFEGARQVAGDFYDFFKLDNSKMAAIVIADVCDKGVGAALFMVLFRSLLRAFSKINIDRNNVKGQLKTILLNTNEYVTRIHGNSNMFATVFFGILDPDNGSLYYINGGHEPPAILDKNGRIIQRLQPTGPAVGILPDAEYKVGQIELDKGDFLVGFTDGTKDAQDKKGTLFTEERLLKYIQAPWSSLFSMLYELKLELKNHMGGERQFDDITLISIRRKLTPDREQHAICRVVNPTVSYEIRDFVQAAAAQCQLNRDDASAFTLAAEEACLNIIHKGYIGRDHGLISLSFEKGPDTARLIIRDDGQYLQPEPAEILTLNNGLEKRKYESSGFQSAKTLMDHVSYTRMKENSNQLILEKNIN